MWYQTTDSGLVISVRVIAGATREGVAGIHGEALKVKVATAPEKGKANERVTDLLSKLFQVTRHDVSLVAGRSSQRKRFAISGPPERLGTIARSIS